MNPNNVRMPDSLAPHAQDYKPGVFAEYTFDELGMWVHNLAKRATHRDNPEKRDKDLRDAQNYLDIMQAKLNALKADLTKQ
jgi:hypothetical protein